MTRIEHLTESGLLARITPGLTQGADVELGPGDDAAVVRLASPRLVITTDTLTEGHDFLLDGTTPAWIGHKAAVQNLADVAAMGARPQAVVVSVSAPRETGAALLEGISAGLAERCARDSVSVVGGDLGAADALSITVTAVGALAVDQEPITRSGARPGQVLAVGSDLLGRSAAGLALVLAGAGNDPDEDWARGLVAWHDAPDPDLSLGWTQCPGRARAMIDVSDGLARDGGRLAVASGVEIDLDREVLGRDVERLATSAQRIGERTGERIDPWEWVLGSGEEHALLATFDPGDVPSGFRTIGIVRAAQAGARGSEEGTALRMDGQPIADLGFDHFG
ncbi:thiamine-phosphate kinase [Brachybacterium endophyticum]|uniref:Thiamine-monophosphate kinase n=1 Tax=Brachybacterium endophyticum TaxID=2182385 RepID=A0A2U2RHW5_9MICO|nr:thiamine-phosphate kinase [Brachybacterium endophyticum]PWH05463.1 thiamine-phosphate kinase [Brachybacterium endophyticum]